MMLIAARNAMMVGKRPYLKRLEYLGVIENMSSYIDSGVQLNANMGLGLVFKPLSASDNSRWQLVFGWRKGDWLSEQYQLNYNYSDSAAACDYLSDNATSSGPIGIDRSSFTQIDAIPDKNNNIVRILKNGIQFYTFNKSNFNGGNAHLFASNVQQEPSQSFRHQSMYVKEAWIYDEDGDKIWDVIPVLDLNGEPKMFDLVSQTYPAHYGTFIAGPELIGGGYKRKCVRRLHRRSLRPSARFWHIPLWKEVA